MKAEQVIANKKAYAILGAIGVDELANEVTKVAEHGYEPTGSFSYVPTMPGKENYFQAVFKAPK